MLGFKRYVAQGGDWGAVITAFMGWMHSRNLLAIHLNMATMAPEPDPDNPLTAEETDWIARNEAARADLRGYQVIQGTRPQTLAYGLTDSPPDTAAWILEKFHDWTIGSSTAPPPFDLDRLLTNVMLYWLGGINAANWMYVSTRKGPRRMVPAGQRIETPTGFTLCPADMGVLPPDSWLKRSFNMVYRRDLDRGGHFLALEQGEVFVAELRKFFAGFR